MSTVTNQSITELVNTFEHTARVPALRGIVHSSMAQAIRWIRTDIFERNRKERTEEEVTTGVDERFRELQEELGDELHAKEFGFEIRKSALQHAEAFYKVYAWNKDELLTLAQNNVWDQPLSPEEMLEFMAKNSQSPNMAVVKEVARIAGTTPEAILKMQEIQALQERERLLRDIPEILDTFNGFIENQSYENAVDELDPVSHHQLGIKAYESLLKAKNGILNRVLRSKRITDLAAVPVLDDAAKQIENWVSSFEKQHKVELGMAIEEGRNFRSIEDVKSTF